MCLVKSRFALPELRLPLVSTTYRSDIDGLRAVAILSVMLFHAFPAALPGGFIGVDIFFVISGFLISRIVFSGLANDNFSFLDFYIHRIRRIFPALIMVMLAALVFGWFALLAGEYRLLGKHVAGGIGFIDNLLLWGEDSYFGTASELKPLMHLWSLGIEEQFYLIFPVLLTLLWRWRVGPLLAVALVAVFSFAANLYWIRIDAAGTFFLPHTRFWELLAGSLLAYGEVFRPVRFDAPRWLSYAGRPFGNREFRAALGYVLLLVGFVAIHKGSAFPGRLALLPVLGAVLVIAAGAQSALNRLLLANRGMVFIGLISYPLYLWHWPVLSFLRILEARVPTVAIRIAALLLTVLLAWLTYRLIEKPLRFGRRAKTKALGLLLAGIVVGLAGGAVLVAGGIAGRSVEQLYGEKVKGIGHNLFNAEMTKFERCLLPETLGKVECRVSGRAHQQVTQAILGDSHSADLFLGLAAQMGEGENLAHFWVTCFPFAGIVENDSCTSVSPIIDYIVADDKIHTVILSNYWAMRLKDRTIRLVTERSNRNRGDVFEKLMTLTLRKLLAAGKNVIFAIDVPDLDFPPEACLPSRPLALTERLPGADCMISRANVEARSSAYRESVARVLAGFPQVRRWDPHAFMCNAQECFVAKAGILLYRDDNHLSPEGARWLGAEMVRTGILLDRR